MLDWMARVVYDATELLFTWQTPPWDIADEAEGGSDVAASGIPEAYEIRRDYILTLRLPFFESEYAAVEAWIHWAQTSGQTFTFGFDQADAEETDREVYLHAPLITDGFRPTRDQFVDLFWIEVSLRTADGLPFDANWSGA